MATGAQSGLIYVKINGTGVGNIVDVNREPDWKLTSKGDMDGSPVANSVWASLNTTGNLSMEFEFTIELLESASIDSTIELYDKVIELNREYFGQEVSLTVEQTMPVAGAKTGTYAVKCGVWDVHEFIKEDHAYVTVTFYYTESGMSLIDQIYNGDAIVPAVGENNKADDWTSTAWGTAGEVDKFSRVHLGNGKYGVSCHGTATLDAIATPATTKNAVAGTSDILIANAEIELVDYDTDYNTDPAPTTDTDYEQKMYIGILGGATVLAYDTYSLTLTKNKKTTITTACRFGDIAATDTEVTVNIKSTSAKYSFIIKKVWFTTRKNNG